MRVLVSSIRTQGGVSRMRDFACGCLRSAGHEPVLAWYEPYSRSPAQSVPLWLLPFRRPSARAERAGSGIEAHAIGAWLPELEFTHYRPTRIWRELMATCDAFVAVSGNCLPATPFALTGRPYLAWVATPWQGDRKDRVASFPAARRLLDAGVIGNVVPRLERRILREGTILALSDYTKSALEEIGGRPVAGVLPVPIDTAAFVPDAGAVVRGRVGFAGRVDDRRKNIPLLLDAVAAARKAGSDITLVMTGAGGDSRLHDEVARRGLGGAVQLLPRLPREQLVSLLQTLDLFVIPSHQEGLCLAALEAMSCGAPVVSTRCGGPEEFVREGETGFLVDADPGELAERMAQVVSDRPLRRSMAGAARALVESRYGGDGPRELFLGEFQRGAGR